MNPKWTTLSPKCSDLSIIWGFLDDIDPAPAREQFNKNYKFGGWDPFPGFTLTKEWGLAYPADPIQYPLAATTLREEAILLYPGDWVAIVQPDGSFEVARLD